MQRITITIDDDLAVEIDNFAKMRGYQSRSEAIRDLTRSSIERHRAPSQQAATSVAAVVYVYDHETRELAKRLTRTYHHHHNLSLATFHVHLDEDTCMEVSMLRGPTAEVQHCAEHVIAERGVRHGQIVMVPMPEEATL
jgi:CopG family nickel-responsive transcriptional regulator